MSNIILTTILHLQRWRCLTARNYAKITVGKSITRLFVFMEIRGVADTGHSVLQWASAESSPAWTLDGEHGGHARIPLRRLRFPIED